MGGHRTLRKSKITYINIFLACLVIVLYLAIEFPRGLIAWGLGLLLVISVQHITFNHALKHSDQKTIAVLVYLVLSIIGICFVVISRMNYNSDFGYGFDDSFYFNTIQQIAEHGEFELWKPFESILAIYYRLISIIIKEPVLLDLLPFNWLLGAITVILAWKLTAAVSGAYCSIGALLACTLGNSFFLDTASHLYRDTFMLVFYLSSLLFLMQNRLICSLIMIIVTSLTRIANGLIVLYGFFLIAIVKIKPFRNSSWVIALITIMSLYAAFSLDNIIKIGGFLRTYSHGMEGGIEASIIETSKSRIELMVGNPNEDSKTNPDIGEGLTAQIYQMGSIGYLIAPFVNMFAPFVYYPPSGSMRVRIDGWGPAFYVNGFFLFNMLCWITAALWIYIGPRIILGLRNAVRGDPLDNAVVILFFITVFAISFVSLQGRHRLAFFVFYPLFMSYASNKKQKLKGDKQLIMILTYLFFVAIGFANAIKYLV